MPSLIQDTFSLDAIYDAIKASDMHVLYVKSGKSDGMIAMYAKKSTDPINNRNGIFAHGNKSCAEVCVLPVRYVSVPELLKDQEQMQKLVEIRAAATNLTWDRYNRCGKNTRHAKDPFHCKAFLQMEEDAGLFEADYVVLGNILS